MHKLNLGEYDGHIEQDDLVELIRICDKAIDSYMVCTGYTKQWKHFKRQFLGRLKSSTKMYVNECVFDIKHIPSILLDVGIITNYDYQKLLPSRELFADIIKMGGWNGLYIQRVDQIKYGHLCLEVSLGDQKVTSNLVLPHILKKN